MRKTFLLVFFVLSLARLSAEEKAAKGAVSDNKVISSTILGYDLQYRVYTPANYDAYDDLPVIYITDGQWYLGAGTHKVLDQLIEAELIRPVVAVFVDNRDPHDLKINRRNFQLLGYDNYLDFYREELILSIEEEYKVSNDQEDRGILGLSFGGLNAAYFGVKAPETFHFVGMLSPALQGAPEIYDLYTQADDLPLKLFLSTGSVNDTENQARRLKRVLEFKKCEFKYMEVDEGHNWKNWGPLLDDIFIYFFSPK